jgi:hypothetical protein
VATFPNCVDMLDRDINIGAWLWNRKIPIWHLLDDVALIEAIWKLYVIIYGTTLIRCSFLIRAWHFSSKISS